MAGGDIITSIDGKPVKRMDDFISYIDGQKKVGDNVNLTTYRDGKTIDIKAILTKRPAATAATDNNSQSNYPFDQLLPPSQQQQPQNPNDDNGNNNNNDNGGNDLFSNFPNFP